MNFSLAPRNNMGSRKPKIHNFGIGVTFNTSPVEEVLQKMMTSRAEDLDEYDYEKMDLTELENCVKKIENIYNSKN